jgi:hypothetical protein
MGLIEEYSNGVDTSKHLRDDHSVRAKQRLDLTYIDSVHMYPETANVRQRIIEPCILGIGGS